MAAFKSWDNYYRFEVAVMKRNRYTHDAATLEFLQTVGSTCHNRLITLAQGERLWRAQLGQADDEGKKGLLPGQPYGKGRMKPQRNKAREGRANPKGIPYFYLAKDERTAMAEVRPWLGSWISLAQFEVVRNLKLVDCSQKISRSLWYAKEPRPNQREKVVWSHINRAFSQPIDDYESDHTADYVPTQIIAEVIKQQGLDGILYKSAIFKTGHSVVLFDLNSARQVDCALHNVEKIHIKFGAGRNPYYL